MKLKTQLIIRHGASIVKIICGYMLIDLFAETSTWVFLISGLLLLIGGLSYLVPYVLDEIQNYVANRKQGKKG